MVRLFSLTQPFVKLKSTSQIRIIYIQSHQKNDFVRKTLSELWNHEPLVVSIERLNEGNSPAIPPSTKRSFMDHMPGNCKLTLFNCAVIINVLILFYYF